MKKLNEPLHHRRTGLTLVPHYPQQKQSSVTDSLAPIGSDAADIPAYWLFSCIFHSDDSDSEKDIVVSPSTGLATGSTLERLMEIMVQQQFQEHNDRQMPMHIYSAEETAANLLKKSSVNRRTSFYHVRPNSKLFVQKNRPTLFKISNKQNSILLTTQKLINSSSASVLHKIIENKRDLTIYYILHTPHSWHDLTQHELVFGKTSNIIATLKAFWTDPKAIPLFRHTSLYEHKCFLSASLIPLLIRVV